MLCIAPMTVTEKVMDTGESTKETVKTIARGMPVIRLHLWRLRSCASSICTRGRGCWLKHPAFPAPSFDFEGGCWQNSGAIVPRERGLLPGRSTRRRTATYEEET